jgi:hypothetical protein
VGPLLGGVLVGQYGLPSLVLVSVLAFIPPFLMAAAMRERPPAEPVLPAG